MTIPVRKAHFSCMPNRYQDSSLKGRIFPIMQLIADYFLHMKYPLSMVDEDFMRKKKNRKIMYNQLLKRIWA
jgi:hypothetical protein